MNIDTLIITHGIKGYPNYVFSGNDMYLLSHYDGRRTHKERKLSLQLNGLTRGYFINRKFKSLTWIEKRVYPVTKVIYRPTPLPF